MMLYLMTSKTAVVFLLLAASSSASGNNGDVDKDDEGEKAQELFDDELFNRDSETKTLKHNFKVIDFDNRVLSITQDTFSKDPSFLVAGVNDITRLSGKDMTVTDYVAIGAEFKGLPFFCDETSYYNLVEDINNCTGARSVFIDYHTEPFPSIISCFPPRQGMCLLHDYNLLNEFQVIGSSSDPANRIDSQAKVASSSFTVSISNRTVFFIPHDHVLFREPVPLLSSRVLDYSATRFSQVSYKFRYTHQENDFNSSVDIHPKLKGRSITLFLFGFHHEGYAYFLLYRDSVISQAILGRVCVDDTSFTSYTEIPIECSNDYVTSTSEVQDRMWPTTAHLGKIGQKQFHIFNASTDFHDVLFVAFAASGREGRSFLCGFNMKIIERKFDDTVYECFVKGSVGPTPKVELLNMVYGENVNCSKTENTTAFFCGESKSNRYIKGNDPLTETAIIETREPVTSLATDVQKGETILFLGFKSGWFQKQRISMNRRVMYKGFLPSFQNERIWMNRRMMHKAFLPPSIAPNPVINREERVNESSDTFLYFATKYSVVKFPLNSCSIYSTCASCLTSMDVLGCGWCGDHCAEQSQCSIAFSRRSCPPVIYDFHPKKAPLVGGNPIVINGYYFGESRPPAELNVEVAGTRCTVKEWKPYEITCVPESSHESKIGKIYVAVHGRTKSFTFNNMNYLTSESAAQSNSNASFEFADPVFDEMKPRNGSKSGETHVIITGKNFDISHNVSITMGRKSSNVNFDYNVIFVNSTHIEFFATFPYDIEFVTTFLYENARPFYPVTVDFDQHRVQTGFNLIFTSDPIFVATSDPIIESVDPKTTVYTGNTQLNVKGQHFTLDRQFKILVTFNENLANWGTCEVNSTDLIICFTPNCPIYLGSGKNWLAIVTFYVEDKLISGKDENGNILYNSSAITYYPDPEYYPFNSTQKVTFNDPVLEISGNHINTAYKVLISVGSYECQVIEAQQPGQLRCQVVFQDDIPLSTDTFDVGIKIRLEDEAQILGSVIFVEVTGFFNEYVIFIVGVSLTLGLLIALLVVTFCCCKKRNGSAEKDSNFKDKPTLKDKEAITASNDYVKGSNRDEVRVPLIAHQAPNVLFSVDDETMNTLIQENKLIAREHLTWDPTEDFVGKGHFGYVFKGKLHDRAEEVAVKTLQTTAVSRTEFDMFIQEALIMIDFCHPRVLHLIGVCFLDDMSPVVVTPFIANGDLLAFLKDDDKNLTVSDLIAFAIEIAEGMQYLASHKFVHRDLAARNCLLGEDNHVKIADFGLSRDVYEKDYYRLEQKASLPVKWLAPETLQSRTFTTKSDVWSYGVVFWEIITRGLSPYAHVAHWDIFDYLMAGRRLPKPDHCPILIYELMTLCWSWNSHDRPTFTQILEQITLIIQRIERKGFARTVLKQTCYANLPQDADE